MEIVQNVDGESSKTRFLDHHQEGLFMTFGQFWSEHHTLMSLVLGVLLTYVIFKIPKLRVGWKILIILVVMFLLTGLLGVLKYLGLVLAIAAIFYGGFVSIWGLGIIAIGWFAASHGWNLKWWQVFLIGAGWAPISVLLDVGIMFIMVFIIKALGIASEKLPTRIKRRLGICEG